jgi:response regulator RpfG family c-di-GMP phosphodiesterase
MNPSNSVETSVKNEAGRRPLMAEKQIKVLIVDDHSGVRAGIKNMLQMAKDMVVVGEGVNGAEAIELVAAKKPDILLLDIELPDQRGDIVMRHIHAAQPSMKVLTATVTGITSCMLETAQPDTSQRMKSDDVLRPSNIVYKDRIGSAARYQNSGSHP